MFEDGAIFTNYAIGAASPSISMLGTVDTVILEYILCGPKCLK